jgi:hypothetical protein
MPVVWGRHDRRRLFINVAIVSVVDAAKGGTLINPKMFRALIDTGATGTCITRAAADRMGLSPIGKIEIQGVSGTKEHNNYLFHIGSTTPVPGVLPIANPLGEVQVPLQLHLNSTPIQGAEFDAGKGGFDVLLGMDVICTGSLKVEGDGTFSWAW